MIIIGLTGSIGMGKSETARMFARLGVPVYDADAAVHALYAQGGAAVAPVAAAFPQAFKDGMIDRTALSDAVLGRPDALRHLESIVHPLVAEVQRQWLAARQSEGADVVVLDIPLLLERRSRAMVDYVVVVSAPFDVQRARVLARAGMSEEKFAAILAKQMPDAEKRAHADFIVDTSQGLDHAQAQVKALLSRIRAMSAPHANES